VNGDLEMSPPIQSYRDLSVWQDAMDLTVAVYELSAKFPKEELYGLSSQVRRACVSIAPNVAEGHGREQTKSFIQFLRISQGSLKETETHLCLAQRLGLAKSEEIDPLLQSCGSLGRRLRALIRTLQERVGKDD